MKKHTLKISTISVLCALCTGLTNGAMAAGSVRALGGAGTVNGTSTAAASTRSVSVPRSASLRVSPSSARLISSAPAGTAASGATTSTGQRLSIGKYLGGATTSPTTSSSSGGNEGGSSSANVGQIEERLVVLENIVNGPNNNPSAGLDDRVGALESQIESGVVSGDYTGNATTGGVVEVTDGTVSVNIDTLIAKLEAAGAISTAPKDIQYTSDHELQYRYLTGNDTEWHTWFDLDDITGDYTTLSDVNSAINTALGSYATTEQLNAKQDKIDAEHPLPASSVSGLATVATTGSYTDLENKPSIPELPTLATVATSGSYDDLENKPTLGTMAAENKTDYYTKSQIDSGIAGEGGAIETALANYTPTSGLAAVATSGSYNDLEDKPTIPAAQVNADWNATSGVAQILNRPTLGTMAAEDKTDYYTKSQVDTTLNAMSGETGAITTQIEEALAGYTPTSGLATVATSGSYNDLENKPTIPAAQVNADWNATSGVAQILNKPTVPVVDDVLSKTSTNPVQNKVVTGALPNFDTTGNALLEPGDYGAYVLGVVDGQRAYIAVVDGNGQTGVAVNNQ